MAITYKDRTAIRYIEAVLFTLLAYKPSKITNAKTVELVNGQGFEIDPKQSSSALSNFYKMGCLGQLGYNEYYIHRDKLEKLAMDHIEKGSGLWFNKRKVQNKGSDGALPGQSKITSLVMRAILASLTKKISRREFMAIAKNAGFVLPKSTPRNFVTAHKAVIEKSGHLNERVYGPNAEFFDRYAYEKDHYIKLFPARKEAILNNFKRALEVIENMDDNAPGPMKVADDKPTAPKLLEQPADTSIPKKISKNEISPRPIFLIRAIYAAYKKPLGKSDLRNIAENNGYKLTVSAIAWFRSNKKNELISHGRLLNNEVHHTASNDFFKLNVSTINSLIDILPDKKDIILSRFNEFVPQEVALYVEGIAPAKNIEVEIVDTIPSSAKVVPQEESETIEDTEEMVSAADVGASIIAYIGKLKSRLNTMQSETVQDRDGKLQTKIENLTATVIGLKSERNNLSYQVQKLEKILDGKEKSIKDLREIAAKNASIIEDLKAPRKSFKMRDVAKITRLVKNGTM